MINLLNAKVSTDHVGGNLFREACANQTSNLLVLAVEEEIDLEIYRSIAKLQLGIPLLILFYIL